MAMEHGAQSKAKTLLQSLAAIFPPPGKEGEPNDQAPPAAPTTVEPTIALGDILAPIRKEGGGSFIIGEVPDHAYRGLPSYYNKNVKAMKGSIPLTIFNPKWQQQAAAHHAKKKTFDKNNPDKRRYTGQPTPSKWTQSYAQWSRNYQSFSGALQDIYTFKTFSEWVHIHRDKCNERVSAPGSSTTSQSGQTLFNAT
jgi:hypothetical protein